MRKKRCSKQRKTIRKKHHYSHDASLPVIEVKPNVDNKAISYLPRIIVDCDAKISRRNIKKINRYLTFANPNDLRYLSSVRIVDPSAITLPSKERSEGCYWPKWKSRPPQIWLSSSLFKFSGMTSACINLFFLRRNRLFEVLFHELGHHKAERIRFVSKHKHEAYAEKYMLAYQQTWQQRQYWGALREKILNVILAFLLNRYFMLAYAYTVRNRNAFRQRMYQLYIQYALRRISQEELWDQMKSFLPQSPRKPEEKRWVHPLQQKSYRKKFRLDEQPESI